MTYNLIRRYNGILRSGYVGRNQSFTKGMCQTIPLFKTLIRTYHPSIEPDQYNAPLLDKGQFKTIYSDNIKRFPYAKLSAGQMVNTYVPFRDFRESYDNLVPDRYYPDNDPPVRLRRYAKYHVIPGKQRLGIRYDDDCRFQQDVADSRKEPRILDPIEPMFRYDYDIMKLLTYVSHLTLYSMNQFPNLGKPDQEIEKLIISMHQVRQIAYPGKVSDNSSEGIHQDGADFIMSALVLNRHNVTGGETVIYDETKTNPIFKTTLGLDQGIFQEDKNLWHDVTQIKSADNQSIGIRDILGLDIKIVRKDPVTPSCDPSVDPNIDSGYETESLPKGLIPH